MIVFDVGCRFGIHPTWTPLKKFPLLKYFAFDPDQDEIERLRKKYREFPNYYPFGQGFSSKAERLRLNTLAHKGQSSFLMPNPASVWFEEHRKEDAEVIGTRQCDLITLDSFCESVDVWPNFIKTDTEGFDLAVLQGADAALKSVISVRCEICFEETFIGAAKFDELFRFLIDRQFILANIDYSGKGVPQSYFCPNPNRWGIVSGAEALFIKRDSVVERFSKAQLMKLVLFLFFNNLEDLAHKLLIERADVRGDAQSLLWVEIKRQYLLACKSLLYLPGSISSKIQQDFESVFGEAFPKQHLFFQSDFLNPA